MKVTGNATLHAPPARVFEALQDPGVLVRTIPGCEQLEAVGTDEYRMTVTAGVASIKGTYRGDVRLTDQAAPDSFVLHAQGAGTPGTVRADVRVRLSEAGEGTTRLEYDADAIVGGMLGGVGQRVLAGVAKKTAGEFFAAVDDVLTGMVAEPTPATDSELVRAVPVRDAGAPAMFTRPPGPPRGGSDFVRGAVLGAGIALLGVLVGGWLAGRRR